MIDYETKSKLEFILKFDKHMLNIGSKKSNLFELFEII